PRGREGQHASELTAAQNADCPARGDERRQLHGRAHLSDGASATVAVCFVRHFANRLARALSPSARMAAAWSAAFLAPLSPIANVATGMPPGIRTMDNKLSIPFK